MEKMFDSMMQRFFNGLSEEDRQKMSACCEKMVTMCPCGGMKDVPEKDMKAMMEKMQSFCGDKMGEKFSFPGCEGPSK